MTRDFAKRDTSRSFTLALIQTLSPRLIGMILLASLTLIFVLYFAFRGDKNAPDAELSSLTETQDTSVQAIVPVDKASTDLKSHALQAEKTKITAASKPQKVKPRFDFYTLLPQSSPEGSDTGGELAKQEPQRSSIKNTSTTTGLVAVTAGLENKSPVQELQKEMNFVLQAGSFKSYDEADNLRAHLSLLGFENPLIKEVNLDSRTWYRVYIGPFSTKAEALGEQQRLEYQKLSGSLILKIQP